MLGLLRVGVRALQRVVDAVLLEHEAPDLLDLRRLERAPAQHRAHALGLRLAHALEHGDERQRPLALAQIGGDGLAEAALVGHEVQRIVGHLEGHADVEPIPRQGLELLCVKPAQQRADAAARRHEGGGLLRDDPHVIRLRGETASPTKVLSPAADALPMANRWPRRAAPATIHGRYR